MLISSPKSAALASAQVRDGYEFHRVRFTAFFPPKANFSFEASTIPPWTWACVGLGGAAIIAAVVLFIRALYLRGSDKGDYHAMTDDGSWRHGSGSLPRGLVGASIVLFVVGAALVGVSLGVAYATRFQTPFGAVRRGQQVSLEDVSFETKAIVVDTVHLVAGDRTHGGDVPKAEVLPVLVVK